MLQGSQKHRIEIAVSALMLVVMLFALIAGVAAAQVNEEERTRTYTAPDLEYSFTYPLDTYSVRHASVGDAPDSQNILFPGIISLEPNDSFVFLDQPDVAYRMMIAAVPTEETLNPEMVGDGPMMHFAQEMAQDSGIETLDLNGVPALITTVPVGRSGLSTQIIAVHENLKYEILIEPVAFNQTESGTEVIDGQAVIDAVLETFTFADR